MRRPFAFLLILLPLLGAAQTHEPERSYSKGIFRSSGLPALTLCIGAPFQYVGRHHIRIADIAAGERHVFVDAVRDTVRRLIVLQFEGFLPSSHETYRYGLRTSVRLGDADYNYDTDYFSIAQARRAHPGAEVDSTMAFLVRHRFTVPDALMHVRFYRVVDAARRREVILFYHESLSASGWTLDQVADSGVARAPFRWLDDSLRARALRAVTVPTAIPGGCLTPSRHPEGAVHRSSYTQYRVAVTNSMPHPMTISFKDTTEHALGMIGAEDTRVFTIIDPAQTVIALIGVEPTGIVTQEVTLRPDTVVAVTF